MNALSRFKKGLFFCGIFLTVLPLGATLPFEEEYIQGHRCLVVRPADLPDEAPVLVILHGFGTNGEVSFETFSRQLDLPPCLLVFPDAPLKDPHLSPALHSWYNRFTHSYEDMKKSREYLFAVMDHYSNEVSDAENSEAPSSPRPVILMGESQGGIMSLEAGLNYKGNLAAIVSICGFIEYPERTLAQAKAPRDTPILMVNGEYDPVVQEEQAQATVRALKKAGYHPELREYETGHKISRGMFMEISRFLQDCLANKQ